MLTGDISSVDLGSSFMISWDLFHTWEGISNEKKELSLGDKMQYTGE